ncbi:hypothetical protein B0H13DRAFT_2437951 [Mycena leptocephala]|nr:hypothetical protein B0H13DRAFT_2437951 [Mycena leptocephala]
MALETTADEDLDALAQWTQFVQERAPLRSACGPATFKSETSESPGPSFALPHVPGDTSPATAETITEFYSQAGFLPPPRADEETIRRQTIQEYDLFRQDQRENFHWSSSLVNSFFHFAPVCTISLFHNDVQVVVSKAGEFPIPLGVGVSASAGTEEVETDTDDYQLHQLDGHWRFTGNAVDSNGVKGYVGVPITLEVDPSNLLASERVTVGVVALTSNRPFLKLSDTQLKVLDDLSTLLSVQLRSTWEIWQRGKETRLRNAVSLFLNKALVEPSQQALMDAAAPEPAVQGSESAMARRDVDIGTLTSALFASAAKELQQLLEADFAIIVDLTSFHATPLSPRRQRSHSWVVDGQDSQAKARLSKGILGSSSSAVYTGQEGKFNTPEAMAAIASFLDMYVANGRSVFSGSGSFSGLEALLKLSSPPTSSSAPGTLVVGLPGPIPHLVLPFYSSHRPNMLIVVASATPFFSFKPADVTFTSNVGVILVAHLAQNAIVEADAAKTGARPLIRSPLAAHLANHDRSYCRGVSEAHAKFVVGTHELRTPLHGLLGQLDLVRDTISSGELAILPSLLDAAEFCGAVLRDIVDDILEFGKTEQASRDGHSGDRLRHVLADLAQSTVESSRSCWLRRIQWQSLAAGATSPPPVELSVEYEDRTTLKNWWISLDLPGFMRILNTLVTNSLKFTSEGLITVSLTSGRASDENDDRHITLRVEDTGLGIAPEFVNKLFDPFTQADSFSPGAGLGLHICKSVVERMYGTITVESRPGGGSIFTVVLPVEDIEISPAGTPRIMHRTLVSSDPIATAKNDPWPPVTPNSVTAARKAKLAAPQHAVSRILQAVIQGSDRMNGKGNVAEDTLHLNILIVDDDAISRKILIRMVKNSNVTTYEAEDGIYALEIFREVHPHVVWTYIYATRNRMDGVTAAKEMRKIEQEQGFTPSHIVAITGLGLSDEYIHREALLGPAALDGWLIKGQTNLASVKETLVFVRQKLSSAPAS